MTKDVEEVDEVAQHGRLLDTMFVGFEKEIVSSETSWLSDVFECGVFLRWTGWERDGAGTAFTN